jgi:hypothetical protein
MIIINEMVMISIRRLIDSGDDRSSPLICRFQKGVPAMDFLNNINAVLHLSDPDQSLLRHIMNVSPAENLSVLCATDGWDW